MSGQMIKIGPRLYWAGKRFTLPGIWLWTGTRNVRVLPWSKRLLPGRAW